MSNFTRQGSSITAHMRRPRHFGRSSNHQLDSIAKSIDNITVQINNQRDHLTSQIDDRHNDLTEKTNRAIERQEKMSFWLADKTEEIAKKVEETIVKAEGTAIKAEEAFKKDIIELVSEGEEISEGIVQNIVEKFNVVVRDGKFFLHQNSFETIAEDITVDTYKSLLLILCLVVKNLCHDVNHLHRTQID